MKPTTKHIWTVLEKLVLQNLIIWNCQKNHWASILNFSEWVIQSAWRLDREHNKFIQFRRPFQVGFVWVICFSSPKYIPTHFLYLQHSIITTACTKLCWWQSPCQIKKNPMKNATNIAERLVAQFQTLLNMENIQELRKLYTCMRFGDLIQVDVCRIHMFNSRAPSLSVVPPPSLAGNDMAKQLHHNWLRALRKSIQNLTSRNPRNPGNLKLIDSEDFWRFYNF